MIRSRVKELLAAVNDCDNCGILPANPADWDTAQNNWLDSWMDYCNGLTGTRPPKKPPL